MRRPGAAYSVARKHHKQEIQLSSSICLDMSNGQCLSRKVQEDAFKNLIIAGKASSTVQFFTPAEHHQKYASHKLRSFEPASFRPVTDTQLFGYNQLISRVISPPPDST
ncbi:hypothetical protein T265_00895 [Opisthorchis viverrini]|uniref:Uncharacterized protein n=1 Tax=Opisthorchis viverrini TaxID=6198 RepID=A0A075AJD6_OPIVI|nr:hypothetical protein T265_00895 [Opisthorchis viverrini]KER33199.1 hypothetical protein T265_00895 [Opisthorchis viverrini]